MKIRKDFDPIKTGFEIKRPRYLNHDAKVDPLEVQLPERFKDRVLTFLERAWLEFTSESHLKNSARAPKDRAPFLVNLSGGIDSSVALSAAIEAVGLNQVVAVTYFHSSMNPEEKEDLEVSKLLGKSLGLIEGENHLFVDLSESLKSYKKVLESMQISPQTTHPTLISSYLAEYLVRTRAGFLNNLIWQYGGGITIDTSNTNELLMGNITAGASLGMVGIIEDLLKCEVYKLGIELGLPNEITGQRKRTGEFGTTVEEMFGAGQNYLDPIINAYLRDKSRCGLEKALKLGHDPIWTQEIVKKIISNRNRYYGIGPVSNIRDLYEREVPGDKHNDLEKDLLMSNVMSTRELWNEGEFAKILFECREKYIPKGD